MEREGEGPSPTVVEPVCVRHGSTNNLEVKSGSLALGTSDRGGFHDKDGFVKSLQLGLVCLV